MLLPWSAERLQVASIRLATSAVGTRLCLAGACCCPPASVTGLEAAGEESTAAALLPGSPEPRHCPALQPTFTKLHVPFTSQTAKQLMRGDKGAAAQLLYGIKSAVDRDGGADSVGPNPTKLAATFGFKMPLSRGLLESNGYRQAASAALQAVRHISSGPKTGA